jgi:flavorubredoxin
MWDWEERMKAAGARLVDAGLTVQLAPDAAGLEACAALGKKLAGA